MVMAALGAHAGPDRVPLEMSRPQVGHFSRPRPRALDCNFSPVPLLLELHDRSGGVPKEVIQGLLASLYLSWMPATAVPREDLVHVSARNPVSYWPRTKSGWWSSRWAKSAVVGYCPR